MAWEIVRREDKFIRDDRPFISISAHRVSFSASFTRSTDIGTQHRVTIHSDGETLRLGFEFHTDDRSNSLALVPDGRSKTNKKTGLFCSSHSLTKALDWVRGITRLPPRDRRFFPKREGKLWVITLCPSFENRHARESQKIPKDANGVYRYLRESGEVVYIGRGAVLKRLQAPERAEWDFDVIEYSQIDDPDQQIYWESFWIDRFKDAHNRLPFYNKVSGAGSIGTADSKAE